MPFREVLCYLWWTTQNGFRVFSITFVYVKCNERYWRYPPESWYVELLWNISPQKRHRFRIKSGGRYQVKIEDIGWCLLLPVLRSLEIDIQFWFVRARPAPCRGPPPPEVGFRMTGNPTSFTTAIASPTVVARPEKAKLRHAKFQHQRLASQTLHSLKGIHNQDGHESLSATDR